MDSELCNNIFTLPPWILFLIIALIPAIAFYLRYRKFEEGMEEYRYWKNKRTELGEEIVEVDLPNYNRFLTVEVFLALLAFGTALLGFLSTNNITYAFTVNQTCIVSQAITLEPTIDIPIPTITITSTNAPTLSATIRPTATTTPTNTLVPQRFFPLPLENGVYWPDGYNVGLSTNINAVTTQLLLDIPFEIGRQINTSGCPPLATSDEYTLQADLSRIQAVYFLIQAGNGLSRYEGVTVGSIELQFSGGNLLSEQLVLGFNIRDWARDKDPDNVVMTISSDMTTEAWQGPASGSDEGAIGGVDILTMEIPEAYQDLILESITVRDTTIENNETDEPCIHLQGVTVEVIN